MKAMKSLRWLLLITGILVALLGIQMLFTPLENLAGLVVFFGIALLVSGIAEIISFIGEDKGFRSGWMLASGILSAIIGLWTILGNGSAALLAVIPFVFAIWIISSSIMRIVGAFSYKEAGSRMWGWVLALGILGTLLGAVLLFMPTLSAIMVSYIIAFMFISYGINNIAAFINIKRIGDHIRDRFGRF